MDNKPPPANNGSRTASHLTTVLIVLQSITVMALVYLIYNATISSSSIFQIINPQRVLTPKVSIEIGFVKVESTKCNLTLDNLTVGNVTYWIREEPTYERITSANLPIESGISFPPGCHTRIFENAFPEGITPGIWRLQGSNTILTPKGVSRQIGWHTETFEIVP